MSLHPSSSLSQQLSLTITSPFGDTTPTQSTAASQPLSSTHYPPVPINVHSSLTDINPSLRLSGESYNSLLVLDLRNQKVNDLNLLSGKYHGKISAGISAYPWTILLLSNNLLSRLDPLQYCINLKKLDLSNNDLLAIPKGNVWKCLPHLQILFLHNNKLDSIHSLQQLSICTKLTILTCFNNPVEYHPAYRHVCVNSIINLKLLDFYIISDEELIENANFGPKYGRYSDNLKMNILNYEKYHANANNEFTQLYIYKKQIEIVNERHRHYSPVLKIQSFFRGVLVRRTIRVYNLAASCIQNVFRKYINRKHLLYEDNNNEQENKNNNNRNKSKLKSKSDDVDNNNKSLGLHSSSSSNPLIFLVKTNDICVNIFMQLVKKVEEVEHCYSYELKDANMILLSQPDIHDDYPLVRRIYSSNDNNNHHTKKRNNHTQDYSPNKKSKGTDRSNNNSTHDGEDVSSSRPIHYHMLPGKDCPLRYRLSLQKIQPRISGYKLNEHTKFLLYNTLNTYDYHHRLLVYQAPSSRFYELLIRAIHQYNIEMGHYQVNNNNTNTNNNNNNNSKEHKHKKSNVADKKNDDEQDNLLKMKQELLSSTGHSHDHHNNSISSSSSHDKHPLIIYPGTTIHVIAAIITIQSAYRSYIQRKKIQPILGIQLAQYRASICISRWWKNILLKHRFHLLYGLYRYAHSINSRHLFARNDIYSLLRNTPNTFVDSDFFPEHRAIFGVEFNNNNNSNNNNNTNMIQQQLQQQTKEITQQIYGERSGSPNKTITDNTTAINNTTNDNNNNNDPTISNGRMTIIVDQNTPVRFYPFPMWINTLYTENNSSSSNYTYYTFKPLPILPVASVGVRIDMSSRLLELLRLGVHVSELPGIPSMDSHQQHNNDMEQQQQHSRSASRKATISSPSEDDVSLFGVPFDMDNNNNNSGIGSSPMTNHAETSAFNPTSFVKFSFSSVEEARYRAITLIINTWSPSFHLDQHYRKHYMMKQQQQTLNNDMNGNIRPPPVLSGHDIAFLMTAQHMQLCLQHQTATNTNNNNTPYPRNVLTGPAGERHILYSHYWLQPTARIQKTIVSSYSLHTHTYHHYNHQHYLDLTQQLKYTEEQHLNIEKQQAAAIALAHLPHEQQLVSNEQQHSNDGNDDDDNDELTISGGAAMCTYQPSLYQLKKDMAESERLLSRRLVAQSRVELHTHKLKNQQKAREIAILHRIRMDTIKAREDEAKVLRQHEYENIQESVKTVKKLQKQQRQQRVYEIKHELARREKLRDIDAELDRKNLMKRVEMEKLFVEKSLEERQQYENDKVSILYIYFAMIGLYSISSHQYVYVCFYVL